MRIIRICVACVLVVAGVVSTVGSGGGGGGSIGDSYYPDLPDTKDFFRPSVDITIANAQDVSATVVRAENMLQNAVSIIAGQLFPHPPSAQDPLPGLSKYNYIYSADIFLPPSGPRTNTCYGSGAVTVAGYPDNDPGSFSVEEEYDLTFDACDDGYGTTIDGGFSLKVVEVLGDPRTDVYRIAYTLSNMDLTIITGVESYLVSGSYFSLTLDSLTFPNIALLLSPISLQLHPSNDAYSWSFGRHALTMNADVLPSAIVAEVENTYMRSARLDGSVTYETTIPLHSLDDQVPDSGEILVSRGSATGTIRIVIESSTSVRLEIDVDGDGIVDGYQYTTWAALQG
jgi:hypothetical protein